VELPALFSQIPVGLFGPLSSLYSGLYWGILARFYQLEFERDPFILTRIVAFDVAEELVAHSRLWAEHRSELVSEAVGASPEPVPELTSPDETSLLRGTARRLVIRLEQAGWFHYEYRSTIGHVLNFYPYAARILETLMRVARDDQPVFQGYAHAIASLLKSTEFAARPGVSLYEAKEQTLTLLRELKILDRNIYDRTRHLLELATASDILEESIDRYGHAIQANYHRLKTTYNLFKWRGEILDRLADIERDTLSLDRAARWYAEEFTLDGDQARRRVSEDLHLLRSHFESLPVLIDDIDTRNARFTGTAQRKIRYLLLQDRQIEGALQFLIERLGQNEAPPIEVDLFRCELLGDGFLYTPRKRRPLVEAQRLTRQPLTDTEDLRRALATKLRSRFGRKEITRFVDGVLDGSRDAPVTAIPLETDEDYIRLIHIAAYGLDARSSYVFDLDSGEPRVQRGRYTHPQGHLRKQAKRAGSR
jgi:hypothetical protein